MSNSRKSMISRIIIILFILPVCLNLWAQEMDNDQLTLKKIFTDREFTPETFGPARWIDKGKGYTTLEKSKTLEGKEIVRYDTLTGKRQVLVPAEFLVPKGESKPLEINDYSWSHDGKMLLIFTNTRKVWRVNSRGDYWVLHLGKKHLTQLGKKLEPSTLMFAKFSHSGGKVAYVSKQNIYVEDLERGEITQITTDGGGHIINGTFDWLYEEELGLRDGFRWSPDSRHIAYWQMDTDGIGTFHMINNLEGLYPTLIPLPYPKVGTTNPAARIGVISVEGGQTRWMDIPGASRDHYLARMDWAASPGELIIQQLNRLQNTNTVFLGHMETGNLRTLFVEKDKAWVDVNDDLHWLKNKEYFTWSSERDGWRHIYLVSRKDGKMKLLTPGDYDVISLEQVDEKGGYIYYIASPDNATERYLYRSRLDGKGHKQRLSPVGKTGHHGYQISPHCQWALHTYSNTTTPPTIALVQLPAHKQVRLLENNSVLKQKLARIKMNPPEYFRIEIEKGVELDGWMIKPPDFDASLKYPVLFHIYGEPAGSTTQKRWGGDNYLWHQMLASQGYIIMSIDNRGTDVPKGRVWRKSIYRQIGILASLDQAAAARQILKWDFVDAARIGIWGWSGGGSMTLNCMFRFPDIYKTGIAIAFISNQKFYDSCYQERYMGLPKDNEYGYKEGSPITHARGLEGNLLLIHGSGDDNCHYQNCEVLVDELIKQNKIFSMMEYPMRSHSISERENTSRHLRELMTHYLNTHLRQIKAPGAK